MTKGKETLNAETIIAWAGFLRRSQALLAAVEGDVKAAGLPPLAWYDVLLELDRCDEQGMRPYELERVLLLPPASAVMSSSRASG